MRITQGTMARNYTTGLHRSLGKLYELSDKATTFRRFNSFAEDTSGAVRAMNVRRNLAKLDTDYDSIKNEVSRLKGAEDSLKQSRELVTQFYEKYLQGSDSGVTNNRGDIATQLTSLRSQMVTMMNSQFADNYLFGGTEGKERIWELQGDSTLTYLGYNVAEGADLFGSTPAMDLKAVMALDPSDPATQALFTSNPDIKACYDKVCSVQYIDIGLGLELAGGGVDPNSAYNATLSGLEIFGAGEDNIILHMNKMIAHMQQDDFSMTEAGPMIDKLLALDGNISTAVTKIGTDQNYLEFSLDRLDSEKINLQERQKDIETIDPEVAIMNMKLQEYAYNAALQMGSRILQSTVFDYLR